MSADLDKFDKLERAIDGAVREMLDVEPPADLRARVMRRLLASGSQLPAAGSRLPAAGFRLPAVGWVLAAAAIILIALVVARRNEPVSPTPVIAHRADPWLPPESAGSATAQQHPPVSAAVGLPGTSAPPRIRGAARPGTVEAQDVADRPGASPIEPLQSIAPITVATIEQDAIAPAAVSVRPLNTISEIQIAPLTPPDRR